MISRLPILGTKGYTIDLLTHEIYNVDGRKLKPFVDGRGRISIKLVRDDGKRQVFIVKDIVKKISPTKQKQKVVVKDSFKEEQRLATYEGFLVHMEEIMLPKDGINRYLVAKDLIPNANLDLLKKILRKISRLPK